MATQKNQHFVPQIYLKNFSSDGKSIELYIKALRKFVIGAPIKNQSSRNYFYGKDLEIENFLSEMEGDLGCVLHKLVDTSCGNLSQDDIEFLFGYTFLQWGRTESSALELVSTSREMNQFVSNTFKDVDITNLRNIENVLDNVRTSICLAHEMLNTCKDLDYKFLINTSSIDYITSDNPVCLYNQFHERIGKHTFAFGSIGTQILFPLSPRIMFLLYDSQCYKIGSRKAKTVSISASEDIINLNNITYINADRVIYFRDKHRIPSFDKVSSVVRNISKYSQIQYPNKSGLFHSSHQPPLCKAKLSFVKETDKTKHIISYSPSIGPLLRKSVLKMLR